MPKHQGKGHCETCWIRPRSIFADLTTDQLRAIESFNATVLTFAPGEFIYHQNTSSEYAYTLRNGLVKLSKSLPDGRNHIVRLISGGGLFGFDGLIEANYNHSSISLTHSELCRLPLKELGELRKIYPEIDKKMTYRWINHLREAEDMMVELGAKKATERLATFLIGWCEAQPEEEWSPMPLTRSEIGELLGLTIETVSRLISRWKREDVLSEDHGRIKINDLILLKQVAG